MTVACGIPAKKLGNISPFSIDRHLRHTSQVPHPMAIFIELLLEGLENSGLGPPTQKTQPGPCNAKEFLLAPARVELLNPGVLAALAAAGHGSEPFDRNVQLRTFAQLAGDIDQPVGFRGKGRL